MIEKFLITRVSNMCFCFFFFFFFFFFSFLPLLFSHLLTVEGNRSIRSIGVSLVFSSPSRSVSFLQSPSCPSFSSLVFSDGKGSVSSLQSSLVQSLRPHLLSLLTVGALRDSSQSGAVGASHACCFTEWSSGNTTQDEADVSTRVTELGVEESQTWEWKDHVFIYTLPQVTTNK
ncbi:uncharacterized protein LOC117131743 [Brassica rapa]|uniref:uncharacterized protein LOC117131743 n=1 Tax=Brassica campestris TaxID=3711 RepID=UPI00142DD5B0|nr:uncharacterized protein LOC117131743 [Brassica rapa]